MRNRRASEAVARPIVRFYCGGWVSNHRPWLRRPNPPASPRSVGSCGSCAARPAIVGCGRSTCRWGRRSRSSPSRHVVARVAGSAITHSGVALSEELTSWCCVRRNASTRVCDVWMKLSTARPRNRSRCTGRGMSSSPPNTRKHARPVDYVYLRYMPRVLWRAMAGAA